MANDVEIRVHPQVRLHKVSRYLYSHFAEHLGRCIYGGIWVGEDSQIENDRGIRCDTANALRKLALPALRWPGGCFADDYHWMDLANAGRSVITGGGTSPSRTSSAPMSSCASAR